MHRTERYVVPGGSPAYPGSTAASLIADLAPDGSRLPVYWCGLYSPCMTLFQPIFIEGEMPPVLAVGGEKSSDESPWWLFHRLTHDALRRGEPRRAEIRAAWRPMQEELFRSADEIARHGHALIAGGNNREAAAMLTRFMANNTSRMLDRARSLLRSASR
jgi:dipeptidase